MWYAQRVPSRGDPELVSSIQELLRSTSRGLVIVCAAVYLLWHLAVTLEPERFGPGTLWGPLYIGPVVFVTCALVLWLVPRRFLAAQAVWQMGFAAAITLAIAVLRQPSAAVFFVLMPLTATVAVGWPAGLVTELFVGVLVWWILPTAGLPPAAPAYGAAVVVAGALAGLTGWCATRALIHLAQWSQASFERARAKMDEARDQQLELKQAQDDLVHATNELARLSQRLKAMNQIAEEARRAKEAFVANVSHELRTPLNLIIGFSEMLLESSRVYGAELPQPVLADIGVIERNSRHLAKLVDDVLDLSQIDAGRMALSRDWHSAQNVVDSAVLAVRPLFEAKGLYLDGHVEHGLPEVWCDITRIRQVVINLLSNAARFTEHGGVRVGALRQDRHIIFSVTDTGPGIAAADRDRVFAPFEQVGDSLHRRHGGSGLGLSISRRFVELHGGRMWIESEISVGTTVYFTLPIEAPVPASVAGVDDATRWFSPHLHHEPRIRRSKAPPLSIAPRFVLMDQSGALQRLLARYLDGAELVSVSDTQQALAELSRSPARALIANLPPSSTNDLGALRTLPYQTPTITCWVPGHDEAARRLGVIDYLVKPVSGTDLLNAIEAVGDANRVLLVDNEREVLQLFSRMLIASGHDYTPLRARNGVQALEMMRQQQPDVVVLDLMMPGMDGFAVLNEKSTDASIRDIPVIVVSARDPGGEPIVSGSLSVTRAGGLSVRDLLECVNSISAVLTPSSLTAGPAHPEATAG